MMVVDEFNGAKLVTDYRVVGDFTYWVHLIIKDGRIVFFASWREWKGIKDKIFVITKSKKYISERVLKYGSIENLEMLCSNLLDKLVEFCQIKD